jgi:hypothetical protein
MTHTEFNPHAISMATYIQSDAAILEVHSVKVKVRGVVQNKSSAFALPTCVQSLTQPIGFCDQS